MCARRKCEHSRAFKVRTVDREFRVRLDFGMRGSEREDPRYDTKKDTRGRKRIAEESERGVVSFLLSVSFLLCERSLRDRTGRIQGPGMRWYRLITMPDAGIGARLASIRIIASLRLHSVFLSPPSRWLFYAYVTVGARYHSSIDAGFDQLTFCLSLPASCWFL